MGHLEKLEREITFLYTISLATGIFASNFGALFLTKTLTVSSMHPILLNATFLTRMKRSEPWNEDEEGPSCGVTCQGQLRGWSLVHPEQN